MHWGRGQVQFSTMESGTIHYYDTPVQQEAHSFKQNWKQKSAQTFYFENKTNAFSTKTSDINIYFVTVSV